MTKSVSIWDSPFHTDAELLSLAADADYAIISGGYDPSTFNAKANVLNQVSRNLKMVTRV